MATLKTLAARVTLFIPILCAACAAPTLPPPPVPSPTPSPTPEPTTITVCLPDEPDSLYLYGTAELAAQHVWQAIYDGPLDSRGYAYQPVILTGLPSLANGDAAVETLSVQAGDRVLAADGEVVELAPGVTVRDAAGQRVTFDGTPIPMPRMVVTFTLHADLHWSDGAPLTADDSVFSFELAAASAAEPATAVSPAAAMSVVERTAGYRAADARIAIWRGIPGFLDRAYFLNFWHPLPRHAWGHLSPAELLSAEISTRRPLGWGPFVLSEWIPGDHITAVRNPAYFRAAEGLPRVDQVIFRFIADPAMLAGELLAGRCDVVTHDAADAVRAALPEQSPVASVSTYDARWELLAFGISPARGYDRPDFFEDVRVRQAVALCVDRQAIVNQVIGPSGRVLHSIVPPEHPLYAGDALTTWEYTPAAGQTLLANAGWTDADGDGVREAHDIPRMSPFRWRVIRSVAGDTPFQVTYHTTGEPQRVQTARLIQAHLAECGIRVNLEIVDPETLFAPGPDGLLFGRRFDLAQFSWRIAPEPVCDLFLSAQVPDTGRWDRPNVTGFLDDEYDVACLSALAALPGSGGSESEGHTTGHVEAQRILSERLPVLPLFQYSKVTLARPSVIGLAPDPTQASELWNVEQLDLRP